MSPTVLVVVHEIRLCYSAACSGTKETLNLSSEVNGNQVIDTLQREEKYCALVHFPYIHHLFMQMLFLRGCVVCVAYEKNRDHGKCILVTMNIQISRFSQMRSNSADSTHTLHPIPPPFGERT